MNNTIAQEINIDSIARRFVTLFNSGDIINSEKCLKEFYNSNYSIPDSYKTFIYNSLGITNSTLGNYPEALHFFRLAENSIKTHEDSSLYLGDILINEAVIYGYQNENQTSFDYYEKGIRVLLYSEKSKPNYYSSLASSYLNLGIFYYLNHDYKSALEYYLKSSDLKTINKLSGLGLVYLNIAKAYDKSGDLTKAEDLYLKSISRFNEDYGKNYYRTAEVHFYYGLYLKSRGRTEEAIEIHKKALSICISNYGPKHSLVSYAYKLLGDDYKNIQDLKPALDYYQKSLIAISGNFNNPDFYSNPSIDSSLFDIRLLDNLKSKSIALEMLAAGETAQDLKLKDLNMSLSTVSLALQLIDRIRNNYLTGESRMYLAENEKDTYLFAIGVAGKLNSATNDKSFISTMYSIAQRSKASVLRNEITENDLLYAAALPDSLRERQNTLSGNIAAYNNLILGETRKPDPDSVKIVLWKDALFTMNRDAEKISGEINAQFPAYKDLLEKTEPVSLKDIQRKMDRRETMIDYFLSNKLSDGKRKLWIFIITRSDLSVVETSLDPLFTKSTDIICRANQAIGNQLPSFAEYTGALGYMFENLISPAEKFIFGQKIIIIPDEEIARLPFDAFLTAAPPEGRGGYDNLPYLIKKYTISYGYSSSLVNNSSPARRKGVKLYAFSPDYGSGSSGDDLKRLTGAGEEIGSVLRLFGGEKFSGEKATKNNFIEAIRSTAIFHLAMHSISDSTNTKYSYLQFSSTGDSSANERLHNYEISLARISSPMVVLSACNSGTGTLYHGEGVMSLARGFILAGASSVIKTSWEVNDAASAEIIERFYFYLSKGKDKAEAMQLAKLAYLKSQPPAYTSPYYWAAYEVLGDNSPVTSWLWNKVAIALPVIIIVLIVLIIYLRRRRIFSARSL